MPRLSKIRVVKSTKEHYGDVANNLQVQPHVNLNETKEGIGYFDNSTNAAIPQQALNRNFSINDHIKKDEELKRLRDENAKLKQENKSLNDCLDFIQKVSVYHSKFFSTLVWFSRQGTSVPSEELISSSNGWELQQFVQDCIRDYGPKFLDKLTHAQGDNGKWFQGFHAGCLASSRLFVILSNIRGERNCVEKEVAWTESVEQQRLSALQEFPMLDT